MFYDTIERHYPDYPLIEDIRLTAAETVGMYIYAYLRILFGLTAYTSQCVYTNYYTLVLTVDSPFGINLPVCFLPLLF